MTLAEAIRLIMDGLPAIFAILGTLYYARRSYQELQAKVEFLILEVLAFKPEAMKIAIVQADMAVVRRDIELIKRDIATMREVQQDDAFNRPQKGELPKLETDETPRRRVPEPSHKPTESPKPPSDDLEGRVDDLEEGIIKDLRIHKVDDPPEE